MFRRRAAVRAGILMTTRTIAVITLDVFTQPRAVLSNVILSAPRVRDRLRRDRLVRGRRRRPHQRRPRQQRRCARRTRAAPPVCPKWAPRAATMQPPQPSALCAMSLMTTKARVIAIRAVSINLRFATSTARRRVPPQRPQRRRRARRTRAAPTVFPRRKKCVATTQTPQRALRALLLIPIKANVIATRAVSTLPLITTAIVAGRVVGYPTRRPLVRHKRAVPTLPTTTVATVILKLLKCVILHRRLL